MLIHELSKQSGVSIHTIRFYEKTGLIKGKRDKSITSNNYFRYDEEALEKLELIRDAKSIGFTLSEIAQLMDAWYSNRMGIAHKLKILDEKLADINQKISHLKQMKKMLSDFKKSVQQDAC